MMLFDTISIRKGVIEWSSSTINREDTITVPNPGLGFYHYDKDQFTKQQAFEILKQSMINNILEDINILNIELNKLSHLKYKE